MEKNIIIGGGISGLSAAYHLEKSNIEYLLFEKESELGGFCRTVKSNNFYYDFTGHLLHFSDDKIEKLVKNLLQNNLAEQERKSFIFLANRYIKYPFQKNLYNLPTQIKKNCLFDYLMAYYEKNLSKDSNNKKTEKFANFADWSEKNFGKSISKYFMLPYNKKLWNFPPEKLSLSWMKSYVPKPSLDEVLKSTFNDDDEKTGYNASFYYPKTGGINALIKAFEKELKQKNIEKNLEISSIDYKKKIATTKNGKNYKYKNLINSSPLKKLILEIIKDVPLDIKKRAFELKTNTVLNINFGVKKEIKDKHWIYFPEEEFIFYRAGFTSNFAKKMAPKGCSSIYTEISLPEDFRQKNYDKYIGDAVAGLLKAKILDSKDQILDMTILKMSPGYVTYDSKRDENVKIILDWLTKNNIFSIGRYGKWEYSDMETNIIDGKNVARLCKI